jgi:peroxin-6
MLACGCVKHLYLASSLLRLHFGRTRCISHLELRRHEALLLSRVVLRALDARAFAYASAHAAALGAALHARLLRQGEVLRVRVRRDDDGEGAHKYEYETLMSEPVLQGVVQVRQEETDTQVLVTLDEEAAAKRERLETRHVEEEEREDAEEQKEELELDEESEEEQEEEEEGDVTIDERFLAHSVLEDFELPPPSSGEGQVPMDEKTDQLGAGAAASSSIASRSFLCGTLLHISRTLERSAVLASISAWRERRRGVYDEHSPASSSSSSSEEEDVDEDLCLLLDERALAAVGAFEGQWAMADLVGVQGQTRLVRLFTEIDAPPRMQGAPTRRATAQVPPMLWQNLHLDTTFDATSSNAMLSLRPLRRSSLAFSSSSSSKTSGATPSCPLPLPFADALTIARVASPRAINRAYQPLFLEALRCHFEARRRVVKQGDVIAVAIEEGRLRWTRKVDQEEEEKEEEEKDEERLVEYE